MEQVCSDNPFDAVGYRSFKDISSENTAEFRQYVKDSIAKAVDNPLQRLSVWLSGISIKKSNAVDSAALSQILPGTKEYDDYLKSVNLDLEDAEFKLAHNLRFDALSAKYDLGGELFNPPCEVLAIAERSKNLDAQNAKNLWGDHTEFDYSKFYKDNLYSEKLRYIIYDMPTKNGCRYENSYFAFLLTVLYLATNPIPEGALRAERVYNIAIDLDYGRINEVFNLYDARLRATLSRIKKAKNDFSKAISVPISNQKAVQFEEDAEVRVEIDSEYDVHKLYAKYNELGLAKDCPKDEESYWSGQYDKIMKLFLRYIREPRRAVKKAVMGSFRTHSSLQDINMLRMNEFQCEDIDMKLGDDEEDMVKTTTTHLFETAKYREELEKADKEINRGISQRMTKKKTLFVGLFAIIAYLFGFLPLIFGNLNTVKSFLFSLGVTGVLLGIFLIIGFVYLFVLRHRLVNRFKHFNYVMSDILTSIEDGLKSFARYLTRSCSVMRGFSIKNYIGNGAKEYSKIYEYHKSTVERIIADNHILFANSTQESIPQYAPDELAYNYDFGVLTRYDYPVPYREVPKPIEFIQKGYFVDSLIDYVNSVTVTREEFYD
ncbi:MAG: hypothetical protein ACI396_08080 [Acutalibacteraceae bacterium]